MQFQVKLMNQTWENGKKPSFRPDFGPIQATIPPPPTKKKKKNIWLRQSLDIIFSYPHVQYQEKLTINLEKT